MAKKKRTIDSFKGSKLNKDACKKVKGGYKFGPSGAGFVGSFVWETIDIRGAGEGEAIEIEPFRRRGR